MQSLKVTLPLEVAHCVLLEAWGKQKDTRLLVDEGKAFISAEYRKLSWQS